MLAERRARSTSGRLACALLSAALLGACPPPPTKIEYRVKRPVMLVPLSLEAVLLTTRRCAYRGVIDSVRSSRFRTRYNPLDYLRHQAEGMGGNVIVMMGGAVSKSVIEGYRKTVTARSVRLEGKAVFCPPRALERLVRLGGLM